MKPFLARRRARVEAMSRLPLAPRGLRGLPLTAAQATAVERLRGFKPRQRPSAASSQQPTTPEASSTMKVDAQVLRRRLGLSQTASEATIRAALAAPATPTPKASPARPAVRPPRPRLTAGSVAAMSSSQLQSAQREALGVDERRLVDEEAEHRTFVALSFPTVARAAGYPAVRRDLGQRSPSVTKGISE